MTKLPFKNYVASQHSTPPPPDQEYFHHQARHYGRQTAASIPEEEAYERLAALELENNMLRGENTILRCQIEKWVHELRRHQEVAKASRLFSMDIAQNLKNLQDATFLMRRRERSADKEWENFKLSLSFGGDVVSPASDANFI